MGFSLALKDLPGYKTFQGVKNWIVGKLPSGIPIGIRKNWANTLIVGGVLGIAGLAVAGIAGILLLGGWVLSLPALAGLGIILTFSALFVAVVGGINYLVNFNWQITDADIEKKIKESFNQFYGLVGEATGNAVGYLVCGALPGTLMFAFNPAVAAVVLRNVGEEGKQEFYSRVAMLAHTVFGAFAHAMFLKSFKSARKWIKRPGTPLHDLFKKMLGEKQLKEWGEKQNANFTITEYTEKQVKAIKDPNMRNFTEQFLEGLSEGCIEAGFIVANTLDSHMAAQRLMKKGAGLDTDEDLIKVTLNAKAKPANTTPNAGASASGTFT